MGQSIQECRPSKICGKQPLKNFIWSILEYPDPYELMCLLLEVILIIIIIMMMMMMMMMMTMIIKIICWTIFYKGSEEFSVSVNKEILKSTMKFLKALKCFDVPLFWPVKNFLTLVIMLQNGQTSLKILKYVWPFCNIMKERVNVLLSLLPSFCVHVSVQNLLKAVYYF